MYVATTWRHTHRQYRYINFNEALCERKIFARKFLGYKIHLCNKVNKVIKLLTFCKTKTKKT